MMAKISPSYALMSLILLFSPASAADGRSQVVPAVNAARVTLLDKSQPKTFVGVVEGAETVAIVARVAGTLLKVNFREGSEVAAGDVLYEIEDTIYAAKVDIARALIEQTEADHDLAIHEHDRSVELLQSKAIPEQSFDMTLSTQKLKRAKVAEARANLVLAEHDLEHCRIVSPISGRIGEKVYSEGNYITPELGNLATVVQYQPIKVQFSMSESDFFRYFSTHDQMRNAELTIHRANGQRYTGRTEPDFVANKVDSKTDTITIHLKCDNPNDQLLPGGFVQILLAEKFDNPLPSVLASALMTDGNEHYVYVVGDNNVIEKRTVVIGDLVFTRQVITEGLGEGEVVVTGGLNKATPGDKVNPSFSDL